MSCRIVLCAAIVLSVLPRIAMAQPVFGTNRGALFEKGDGLDEWRKPATVGRLVPVNQTLTPCDRFSTLAFSVDRKTTNGLWTGRFTVTQLGTGEWSIVVAPSTGEPQR